MLLKHFFYRKNFTQTKEKLDKSYEYFSTVDGKQVIYWISLVSHKRDRRKGSEMVIYKTIERIQDLVLVDRRLRVLKLLSLG